MISILGYGCSSAAGSGVEPFWNGLVSAADHSRLVDTSRWRALPEGAVSACAWADPADSMKQRLVSRLIEALTASGRVEARGPLGVIFASAKGCLEDVVWEATAESPRPGSLRTDPLTPCLDAFLEATGLAPVRSLSVSNACASSHAALFLASQWIREKVVSEALVVAADGLGPFVYHGFKHLGALGAGRSRPFAADRDGLQLGEAAAVVWLSGERRGNLTLGGIGVEVEGFAVTRSSESGAALARAIHAASGGERRRPGLIVAHGTGTVSNDATEDRVFSDLFGPDTPPVTATKWSIGHTLGTSGLMDVIAGCEALRRGSAFALGNTPEVDPRLASRYLHAGAAFAPDEFSRLREVLVTSLGFGGVHAAVRLGVGS